MRNKSVLQEAQDIQKAVELIRLGARMQMLEAETALSRERLLKLYKEVMGKSPSKGPLPFSTEWFTGWQGNVHASLFLNIHEYLNKTAVLDDLDLLIKAYKLYLEQVDSFGLEPVLGITRAWSATRFVDNGVLTLTACSRCKGKFLTHAHEIAKNYVCGLCSPPSRASIKLRQTIETTTSHMRGQGAEED